MESNKKKIEILKEFKNQKQLSFGNSIVKLNATIESEYRKYIDKPSEYKVSIDFDEILKCCQNMKAQLIPYSALTDTIFNNDVKDYSKFNKSTYETDFASMIEGAFEKYLIGDIDSESEQVVNSKPFGNNSIDDDSEEVVNFIQQRLNDNEKEIIVFYKIIEHLRLAINQKNGLYNEQKVDILELTEKINQTKETYNEQKVDIRNLTEKINQTKETYDSMISNYISILGILAAILMTAFGGIQGFTAIFNKNNNFSVVDSIIIACIGFLGIILMIFMLLNGISKLAGKSISSFDGDGRWYQRHPTLLYSFTILTTIILTLLCYKLVVNHPSFDIWWFMYAIPVLYFVGICLGIQKFKKNNT